MTAPASIPALIAEGRRLIAAATPGPVRVSRANGHPTDDAVVTLGGEWFAVTRKGDAPKIVFAVNNLAALLDVAEAGDALLGYHDRCGVASGYGDALRSALSRLRGVRT